MVVIVKINAHRHPTTVSRLHHFILQLMEHVRFVGQVVSWAVRCGCLGHLIQEYVFEFSETRGELMLPTLQQQHDYVATNKRYRLGRGLDMGDCIVAMKPLDPLHRVCKRITGMPGDVVLVDPLLSLELSNSPASVISHDGYNKYIVVPEGHVWATGDNLALSLDSRSYGVVPMGLITGKIVGATLVGDSLHSLLGIFGFKWLNYRKISNTFVDD